MEINDKEKLDSMINENIRLVKASIETCCRKVNRSFGEITLIAVTKTVSIEKIECAINSGITDIAENRVQEAQEKFPIIGNKVKWHLVGHLQTNKVKKALDIFSMIQSIDSLHLAAEVEKRTYAVNKYLPILIEINTSDEQTKFGVKPIELFSLIQDMLPLSHIKISGLMTIGPGLAIEDPEKSRPCFRMLYDLGQKVESEFGIKLPYLSMGMSSDFEVGIEEGSNMIRIGTAIFGQRV